MEQREKGCHDIGAAKLDNVVALLGVRDHVLVREFDTLRSAFGTRTEQDDCVVVQVGCGKPQTA